jgi:Tol biopolymer transport system component
MRYDDPDVRLPAGPPAAAPVWQVIAIVALLATGALLVLSFGLAALLIVERARPRTAVTAGPNGFPNFPPGGDGWQEPANPPYPVRQDLRPPGPPKVPGEAPEAKPAKTARQRFLELAQEVWKVPPGGFPQELTVSPDGQKVAYVDRPQLWVGPLDGEAKPVSRDPADAADGTPRKGAAPRPLAVLGRPAWSADSRSVYFADQDGGLRRYDVESHQPELLPFPGDAPVPLPDGRLVFRRARPAPKADLPGGPPSPDPREIVLADLGSREVRVLLREEAPSLTPLAVSPDGKRLALVSTRGQANKARLAVLDLDAGTPAEAKPIGPTSTALATACWSDDGKALLYARAPQPLPPDCWDAGDAGFWANLSLFRLDVATREETRLSRGAGFGPPGLAAGGQLFIPTWTNEPGETPIRLYRAPLAALLDFAAHEPTLPVRDRDAWTRVLDDALEKARVPPTANGEALPPEVLERLADAFTASYRDHFKTESPADAAGWERQQRELRALAVPEALRPRFVLVLGAAQGEYLRRKHGATWYMGAGPLVPAEVPADKTDDSNPFGIVLNPYREVQHDLAGAGRAANPGGEDDEEDAGPPLAWMRDALVRAQGRTLLLTNDPASAKDALAELGDPDLARATELLNQKNGAEADRLLLDLVGRPKVAHNDYLVLFVGKRLYEHGRFDALRRLLEPRVEAEPRDPHRYNLLGLALLESDSGAAADQFKNALRCDLRYGPAWLNLAEAYAHANDRPAAVLCLRHYLHGLAVVPYADDARQRLAALTAER